MPRKAAGWPILPSLWQAALNPVSEAAVKVFIDFEASSLSDRSYPIEVAWVLENGPSESYLIAPAPQWDDWDPAAEAIHGISRATLEREGKPNEQVAIRMVEALGGHELFASAPSWDGKWLSVLLRSAGLPRHALRLRDTDEALRATAIAILGQGYSGKGLEDQVARLVADAGAPADAPAHRALADARSEFEKWRRARDAARHLVGAD